MHKRRKIEPWWTRRWNETLASLSLDSRFRSGQAYARQGNVINVAISKGLIEAKVQGSRPRPYRVSIRIKQFTATEWETILAGIVNQAGFSAQLLAGEMPDNMDKVLQNVGVSFLPQTLAEFSPACSCPDIANPCKHIVAVLAILGQEFGCDPFLIFTLRGKNQSELMKDLARERAMHQVSAKSALSKSPEATVVTAPDFSITPSSFWGKDNVLPAIVLPTVSAAQSLGQPPGWPDDHDFQAVVAAVYQHVRDILQ